MTTRLNVNIDDETVQAIRDLKFERGINATEVVRRAVGIYRMLQDAQDAGQEIVLVKEARHRWQRDEYTHLELL